jgi:hypothetical protein
MPQIMKQILTLGILVFFSQGRLLVTVCHASTVDHLVPLEESYGLVLKYEQLSRETLLVTSGEIARFISLPGSASVESSVSVYQMRGKKDSLPGDYWVTVTQSSGSLWEATQSGSKPEALRVERLDAPLPAAVAQSVHDTWVRMLMRVKPAPRSEGVMVDSTQDIFSTSQTNGSIIEGQTSSEPGPKTKELLDIAFSLFEYCDASAVRRVELTRKIEQTTSNLLGRLASNSRSKKHKPKSASSPKAAMSPRKQSISQPIAAEKLARPQSVTRLGSSIGDFIANWGPPSHKETLVRSASLKWKRHGANGGPVVPGAFAVDVAFVDGIAREIALRSTQRMTPHKLVKLVSPFVTTFSSADFVKADADAFPAYKLSDGTFVWADKHKKHTVIVIKSPGYSRNEKLSNRD